MTTDVAVLGTGLMGSAIARLALDAGYDVRTYDPAPRSEVASGAGTAEVCTSLTTAIHGADVIFEAAPERLEVKRQLLREIDTTNPTAIVASNTSTFMPSVLARSLSDPTRLVVAHFFNPATHVPLVEVVAGPDTSQHVIDQLMAHLRAMGKEPVLLPKECPGFVANRLQAAMLREAFALSRAGVVTPEGLDTIVRLSLGPRWAAAGPFEVMDLGGLDVFLALCGALFPDLANDANAPFTLQRLVAEGRLGAKSGQGIYRYDDERLEQVRGRIVAHLDAAGEGGRTAVDIS